MRQMQLTTGIFRNMSPRMECYAPNTDLYCAVWRNCSPPLQGEGQGWGQ